MNNGDDFEGWGLWLFALLMLNNGGWGNNGNAVTASELANSQNAQTQMMELSNIGQQLADQNYQTAQLISQQTNTMLQQNNTNLVNAIQGFNTVNQNIQNQTNVLSSQLQQLGAQMNECCCSIKTQMLQQRLEDTQARLVEKQNEISNLQQSQYILGQMGRFVAWAGSGSQTANAAG